MRSFFIFFFFPVYFSIFFFLLPPPTPQSTLRTSIQIFDCELVESDDGSVMSVLTMDNLPCPSGSLDLHLILIGVVSLIFYGILPFAVIGLQLFRFSRKNLLQEQIDNNHNFRILYGWASLPYKPKMVLWEVFNAFIKFAMVATTIVMNSKELQLGAHTAIITLQLVCTAVFRPYRLGALNKIIILFCVCDFLGISAQWFVPGSEGEGLLQFLYILSLLFTIVIFVGGGISQLNTAAEAVHSHMQTKEQLHYHNKAAGLNHLSLSEAARELTKLSQTEIILFMPFMFILVLPLAIVATIFYGIGVVVEKLLWCLVADKGSAGVLKVFSVRSLDFLRQLLFTPVYLLSFVSLHTFVLNIVTGFGMHHFLSDFEILIWSRMHGKKNPLESHHHFRPIHKKSRMNHGLRVTQHAQRLDELQRRYGSASKEYKGHLQSVHDDINMIIDEQFSESTKAGSSATKVVPVSARTGIRKVVSIFTHAGPHKGHEVGEYFIFIVLLCFVFF